MHCTNRFTEDNHVECSKIFLADKPKIHQLLGKYRLYTSFVVYILVLCCLDFLIGIFFTTLTTDGHCKIENDDYRQQSNNQYSVDNVEKMLEK